jgi:hypothetical protein
MARTWIEGMCYRPADLMPIVERDISIGKAGDVSIVIYSQKP